MAEFQLDASYNVAHQVSAVGDDTQGDLHEFKITKEDTALLTVYTTTKADLSTLLPASFCSSGERPSISMSPNRT